MGWIRHEKQIYLSILQKQNNLRKKGERETTVLKMTPCIIPSNLTSIDTLFKPPCNCPCTFLQHPVIKLSIHVQLELVNRTYIERH